MDGLDTSDARLLKPAEVAELLGVSRSWLYEAAKTGRIPCVRLGSLDGPVRFRPAELEAWITQTPVTVPQARDPRGEAAAADARTRARRSRRRAAADVAQLRPGVEMCGARAVGDGSR